MEIRGQYLQTVLEQTPPYSALLRAAQFGSSLLVPRNAPRPPLIFPGPRNLRRVSSL